LGQFQSEQVWQTLKRIKEELLSSIHLIGGRVQKIPPFATTAIESNLIQCWILRKPRKEFQKSVKFFLS
jgi:hypothetical protein